MLSNNESPVLTSRIDLAAIGHTSLDNITTEFGSVLELPGGSALYICAIAAVLGLKTLLASRVGIDFPHSALLSLQQIGVSLGGIQIGDKPSTRIALVRQGKNVTDFRIQYSPERLSIDSLPDYTWNARCLHLSPMEISLLIDIAKIAKLHQCLVSFNLQYYLDSQYTVANIPLDVLKGMLQYVGVLFCNQEEICAIAKRSITQYADAAYKIAQLGPPLIVVTRGEYGATIFHKNEQLDILPYQSTNIIDLTGAGDSFVAGFLAGYLKGLSINECGELGARTAARCIQDFGCQGFLGKDTDWKKSETSFR